jgi:hypothetical protein
MGSINLLDGVAIDMADLDLEGLTVTRMREVVAPREVGEGPMAAFTSCIPSSCSTSCCTVTD